MATGLLTIEAITSQTRYAVTVNEVVRWEVGESFGRSYSLLDQTPPPCTPEVHCEALVTIFAGH